MNNQGVTRPQIQTTTTPSSLRISALTTYYETTFPAATPTEILSYVTAHMSQQQQPQQPQVQSQFQAQPPSTQQTQPTPIYYATTYNSNQVYPGYFYG